MFSSLQVHLPVSSMTWCKMLQLCHHCSVFFSPGPSTRVLHDLVQDAPVVPSLQCFLLSRSIYPCPPCLSARCFSCAIIAVFSSLQVHLPVSSMTWCKMLQLCHHCSVFFSPGPSTRVLHDLVQDASVVP